MELMLDPCVNPLKMGRQLEAHPLSAENVSLRQDSHADDLDMIENGSQECLSISRMASHCFQTGPLPFSLVLDIRVRPRDFTDFGQFHTSRAVRLLLNDQSTWCLWLR